MTNISGISQAIEAAGGVQALADAEGVSHQAVYDWRKAGYAPKDRAHAIGQRYGIPTTRLLDPRLLAAMGLTLDSER